MKDLYSGRQAKELSQKEFAAKIQEKPQIVTEYEQGKALPNQQILAKMERALGGSPVSTLTDSLLITLYCAGIKLRGKDKGQPLEPKGKKK